jgi:hypothetical protein
MEAGGLWGDRGRWEDKRIERIGLIEIEEWERGI